jgi:dipeptidyl aminopeptidase/acylaminoacyl peptidase
MTLTRALLAPCAMTLFAMPLAGQGALPVTTQSAGPAFDLSVDNIMRGPDLVGTAPSLVRFSDDSRWVYFRWRRPGTDTTDTSYRVRVEGGEPEALAPADADTLYPVEGEWSRDRQLKVFVLHGDVWLYDVRQNRRRRLTDTPGRETDPAFSPDARTVYFVRDNNLFSLGLDNALLRQLTDVRRGAPPAPGLTARDTTGQRGFLRAEERALFEVIRRPPREDPGPFLPRTDSTLPRPIWLADSLRIDRWDVSPDGRWLLLTVSTRPSGSRAPVMPVWMTASGYVETQDLRTKVGDEQSASRVALVELATGAITWPDLGLGPRAVDVEGEGWSSSGQFALLRGIAEDYKDRWLWILGPPASVHLVDALHDSAWVGELSFDQGWIEGRDAVWFTSERTGWAHLYAADVMGEGAPRALTPADRHYEVRNVRRSPDGRRFYFASNETNPGEQHLFAIRTDGTGAEQLTHSEGWEDAEVSPDERWLAVLHSRANHPPELYLQPNRAGAAWRQVTESTTPEWRRNAWRLPELVLVPASDGAQVPAQLYRAARPNGGAVIFVHGAGYLQNVTRGWSYYYREYMFHHLLNERGYAVLDLDYRGSAGYGRDWRTAIYRHMGGRDLDDQVDGARWLVRTLGVDSARIGMYGGSYGGFITLMAMFTRPGVFAAGAALRPVTDWAHYNHWYTMRILNEPQDDSVAYRQSSPIYFAEGLRGPLLILHGMVDDNVNYQDVVRLEQRLIELRKDDWVVASYPAEPHSFRTATSWADEYRRILRLFETNLARR